MLYSLNEIFYSIQGEGRNTGMPAWFIRFAGCNLNCPWCDTDYTKRYETNIPAILKRLQSNSCKNVILTGGEPTLQNLEPLLERLKDFGYYTAIETNGTNSLSSPSLKWLLDWVTVSPKKLPIKANEIDAEINEIKVVWPAEIDLKVCIDIPAQYYYLQPLNMTPDNIEKAVEIVKQNPKWRLSLQTQKMIGVK